MSGVFGYPNDPTQTTGTVGTGGGNGGVNVGEGVATVPSLNNADRGLAGDLGMYRNDTSGKLTTSGTANAYTVSLESAPTVLALADGISFKAIIHATNTGAATINVSTQGAKKVLYKTAALSGGELVLGQVYSFAYDASADSGAGAWLLENPAHVAAAVSYATSDISNDSTVDAGAGTLNDVLEGIENDVQTITAGVSASFDTLAEVETGKLSVSAKASEAEAEDGTDDTNYMTSLRTADAISVRGNTFTDDAGAHTAVLADNNTARRFTAAATLTLTAAATLGNGWSMVVSADGGDVTIDPDGSETVSGETTLDITSGQTVKLLCDGSRFFVSGAGSGGGSGLVVVASVDLSGESTADFTAFDDTLYSGYIFMFGGMKPSSGGSLLCTRFSTDGGSTFISANYSYALDTLSHNGTQTNITATTAAYGQLTGGVLSSSGNITGQLALHAPDEPGYQIASFSGAYIDSGSSRVLTVKGGVASLSTSSVDAIQFYWSTGTLPNGRITMIGIPKA